MTSTFLLNIISNPLVTTRGIVFKECDTGHKIDSWYMQKYNGVEGQSKIRVKGLIKYVYLEEIQAREYFGAPGSIPRDQTKAKQVISEAEADAKDFNIVVKNTCRSID